jgi:hypothetical protein
MRTVAKALAVAAAIFTIGQHNGAKAAFVGTPLALRGAIQYIKFDAPTLPAMAFTMFCLKYTEECKPRRMVFRRGRPKLTAGPSATN